MSPMVSGTKTKDEQINIVLKTLKVKKTNLN